jgi:hypothetical protein
MIRMLFGAALLLPAAAMAGGPSLTIGGACPGSIDVAALGLTASGSVAVLSGRGPGSDFVPGGPCGGAASSLSGLGLITTARADGSGRIAVSPTVSGGLCGTSVQFMDLETCALSNVAVIGGGGGGGFSDSFEVWDGSIWDSWPDQFDYADGSLLVTDGDAMMRTADQYSPTRITGSLNKDDGCSDHYVVLSTNPAETWSWGSDPDAVKFVWNCNTKYIYGSSTTDNVTCDTLSAYDIDISISGTTATFSDSICADIRIDDPVLASGPLWVYVGADCDGCTAEWYELNLDE